MESPTGGERALPSPVLHVNMSLFLQRKHEKLLAMVEARLLDAETEEELHRAQALGRLLEEARKATLRIAAEEEEPPVVQEEKQTTEVTAAPPPAKETPGTCPDATATTPPPHQQEAWLYWWGKDASQGAYDEAGAAAIFFPYFKNSLFFV